MFPRNSTIYIHSSRDNVVAAADKFLSIPTTRSSVAYARVEGMAGEGGRGGRDSQGTASVPRVDGSI